MAKPSLTWFTKRGRPVKPAPFLIAGIVNVTPDSFSDGGKHFAPQKAYSTIIQMIEGGADMIDLGGESTRPGAEDIGSKKELERLSPVFSLLEELPESLDTCFSLDTFRAATARAALERKAVSVINDVSGATLDPAMGEVLGHFKPGYVLGHCPCPPAVMQEAPVYDDVVQSLLCFFEERMDTLVKAGLPEDRIALDPCIGFAKNLEHNLHIIRQAETLASLGRPLYFGISRKSLFRDLFGATTQERDGLTQVLTALLAFKGVQIHRVHDVPATIKTLRLVVETGQAEGA